MILSAKTRHIKVGDTETDGSPDSVLQASRRMMKVSRRQARLALGESRCILLDQAANDTQLPWAMRDSIKNFTELWRTAPEVDDLKWLLDLDDNEVDQLFKLAQTL